MEFSMSEATPSAAIRELAAQVKQLRHKVQAEVSRIVVGMDGVVEQLLIALLGNGHVLLEGVPGVAKTTISKAFPRILGCQYHPLQFTPDLLPPDAPATYIFTKTPYNFYLP